MHQSRGGSRFGGRRDGPRDRDVPPRSPFRNRPPPPPRRRSRSPSPHRNMNGGRRGGGDMYTFNGSRNDDRRDDSRTNFNFRMPTRRPSPPRGGRPRSPPGGFRDRGFDQGQEFQDRNGGDHYRGAAAAAGGRSPRHEDRRGRPPPRGPRHWNPNTRDAIKDRYQQSKFPFRKPIAAHDRPILHAKRESTPEQLEGMQKSAFEFAALEEEDDEHHEHSEKEDHSGSDSEDAPMDIEDDEDEKKDKDTVVKEGDAEALEQAERAKKNVIALIRKAKKAAPVKEQRNAVADNDDFIPLDFGFGDDKKDDIVEIEEEDEESSSEEDEEEDERRKMRKTSAVSGTDGDSTPRFAPSDGKFSHRDTLHQILVSQTPTTGNAPPGAAGTVTAVNGPPPGLKDAKKNVFGDEDSDTEVVTVAPPNPRKRKMAERSTRLRASMQGHFRYEYRIPLHSSINPTPWLRDDADHSQTLRMNDWLHKEIVDFVEFLGPTDIDKAVRQHVIHRVQKAVLAVFRDADIRCFGSFASNFFLPGSDLDLVLLSRSFLETGRPKYNEQRDLYDVASIIRSKIAKHGSVLCIAKARVPIIKFVDELTGLHVDISFENTSGLRAIATLKEWRTQHPALPFLTTMFKQYLLMRNMHEVYEGGIGGFSIICMIVAFLRLHPAFASGSLDPRQNLGVAFMEFLDLYGNRLNTYEVGINPAEGKYFTKPVVPFSQQNKHHRPYLLSITDPNDTTNDIAKSSYQVLDIFKCFSESLEVLRDEMDRIESLPLPERKGESLLKPIFGGNYTEVIALRAHMQKIFNRDVPPNFLPQGDERDGLIDHPNLPPPPPPPADPYPKRNGLPPKPPPPPPVERNLPPMPKGKGPVAAPTGYRPKYGKHPGDVKYEAYDSSASSKHGFDDDELVEVGAGEWEKGRKRARR